MALAPTPRPLVQYPVTIGEATVQVEVADTENSREQGLSGRQGLEENNGMLFVFDEPGEWGIWMKDMLFPIDIIWLAKGGTIVTMQNNVTPATYLQNPPEVFYPSGWASYVIELPAGFLAKYNIKVGDSVTL